METGYMKFGVNSWVWTSPLSTDALKSLVPKVAGMGFELIELPLERPVDFI
jgi:D-psicose/D-tagatose/L-ribulose 3-epimerase